MHTQEKSDQLYTSISFVYTKKQPEAYNIIYQVAVYANRTDMYIIKKNCYNQLFYNVQAKPETKCVSIRAKSFLPKSCGKDLSELLKQLGSNKEANYCKLLVLMFRK